MSSKILTRLISFLLIAALCFAFSGCQSEAARLASEAAAEESRLAAEAAAEESRLAAEKAAEEARQAEIERKIIEVLDWVPAVNGFSLSLSSAIVNTFHQYKWDFVPYQNSATRYKVTFTGNYSPNPRDLPQLSQEGTVSWIIDIENCTASVYSDPNDICSAFILLAIPF